MFSFNFDFDAKYDSSMDRKKTNKKKKAKKKVNSKNGIGKLSEGSISEIMINNDILYNLSIQKK